MGYVQKKCKKGLVEKNMNKEELKSFAITAQNEIDNGSAEDRLRHLLSASLSKIFPDSP